MVTLFVAAWPFVSIGVADGPGSDSKVDRGFNFFRDARTDVPQAVHVVKIDRSRSDLQLHTTLGGGSTIGMAVVSEQAKQVPAGLGRPVAAVNGDFYHVRRYFGDPMGLQISAGELISGPAGRVCLWIDADGQPHSTNVQSQFKVTLPNGSSLDLGLNEERKNNMAVLYTSRAGSSTRTTDGLELILEPAEATNAWMPLEIGRSYVAKVKEVRSNGVSPVRSEHPVLSIGPALAGTLGKIEAGMALKFSTATVPDLAGTRMAIGANPTLVRNGKALTWSGNQPRHPRSALGWSATHLFLVEVDGRQRGVSVGMSFPELADYMVKLGCTDAVNLDGGGSATMWVMGSVVNQPCEGHERPSANAVVLVQKQKETAEAKPPSKGEDEKRFD